VITSSQDWTTDLVILSHSAAHLPRESTEISTKELSFSLFIGYLKNKEAPYQIKR